MPFSRIVVPRTNPSVESVRNPTARLIEIARLRYVESLPQRPRPRPRFGQRNPDYLPSKHTLSPYHNARNPVRKYCHHGVSPYHVVVSPLRSCIRHRGRLCIRRGTPEVHRVIYHVLGYLLKATYTDELPCVFGRCTRLCRVPKRF